MGKHLDGVPCARVLCSKDADDADEDAAGSGNDSIDFLSSLKSLTRWDAPGAPSPAGAGRALGFAFPGLGRPRVWEEEMSPEVASLSGMVNVEALVATAAANDTAVEELLPDLGDLKRSIDTETTKLFPFLDSALRWEDLLKQFTDPGQEGSELKIITPEKESLPEKMTVDSPEMSSASSTEKIFQDATQQLEYLINGTSYVFSPSTFQSLILRASSALATQEAPLDLTAFTQWAGKAPRATADYTEKMVAYASGVLAGGYDPLFERYPSVRAVPRADARTKVVAAAEHAALAGAAYEAPVATARRLGHSVVARGRTANVGWMITDRVGRPSDIAGGPPCAPTLVRTFVFRGYDASDERVDREELLNVICAAAPVPVRGEDDALACHGGLLSIARLLYSEMKKYVEMTSPSHKFVFTGHSIGGSLAILVVVLLTLDRGASFVRENVLRVFTFGAPPVFAGKEPLDGDSCSVLATLDLPTDLVYGYCQPWDPIVRLFSRYDPLYPLIDDLGEDGFTPWVSGPSRTLRPILKTILESWEGWPRFRDSARVELGQNFRSVGEQYLLLPEPIRYLTDRLVSLDTTVPPIESIVQVSSHELLPALDEIFELDTFTISYVTVAIRSFIHHFYPAYGAPVVDYAKNYMDNDEKDVGVG